MTRVKTTEKIGDKYVVMIDATTGIRSITCLLCNSMSYNPNDIENRYCAACHKFLEEEV